MPEWWEQGTPLWVSAEQQGIPTATMFWPGSDYKIHGIQPYQHEMFDQKLPDFARVDILLRSRQLAKLLDQRLTAGRILKNLDQRVAGRTERSLSRSGTSGLFRR